VSRLGTLLYLILVSWLYPILIFFVDTFFLEVLLDLRLPANDERGLFFALMMVVPLGSKVKTTRSLGDRFIFFRISAGMVI